MLRFLFLALSSGLIASAQIPTIGVVDFYGLRKVPEDRVRKALGVEEGSRLPASKSDVEEKLESIPGVVLARLEAVCCVRDRAILYVGVEERGAPHFDFRDPPMGTAALPDEIVSLYREFLTAFERAARAGDTDEDLSSGHPLAGNAEVRTQQEGLQEAANANVALLRDVLRNSSNEEHRAIAAGIVGYARNKEAVIPDLQYAMQDPDESVRANAMRALGAMAAVQGVRVEATWFVEMLNSIVWSDRYRAALALLAITESRPENVLAYLSDRARPALVEMARWKTPEHARPAFILVGRMAGIPEDRILAAWKVGDRKAILGAR